MIGLSSSKKIGLSSSDFRVFESEASGCIALRPGDLMDCHAMNRHYCPRKTSTQTNSVANRIVTAPFHWAPSGLDGMIGSVPQGVALGWIISALQADPDSGRC